MAINFPSNPSVNDNFTSGSNTWIWDGIAWNIQPSGGNLNSLSDVNVTGAVGGQVLYYNDTFNLWEPFTLTSTFNGGSISNALKILNSTTSSGTTTGALTVSGGVGISGRLYTGNTITTPGLSVSTNGAAITGNSSITGTLTVSSTLSVTSANLEIRGNNRLRFYDADNSNYISLRSPANLSADYAYQLPSADGTSGQVLTTNGAGSLSWTTVSSSGGGGGGVATDPAGLDGQIQFNNNGLFGADSTLTFDVNSSTLGASYITVSNNIDGGDTASLTGFTDITLTNGTTVTAFVASTTLNPASPDSSIPTVTSVKTYVDTALALKSNKLNPVFSGTVTGVTKSHVGLSNVENTALSTWTGSTNITTIGTLPSVNVTGSAQVGGDVTTDSNFVVSAAPTSVNHATNKKYVDTRAIAMSIALS